MQDLTSYQKRNLSYPHDYGALVQRVGDETPANKAGIKPKDIIMEWDGKKVRDFSHLIGLIQRSEVNKFIPVNIWRNQNTLILNVQVAEFDSNLAKLPIDLDEIKNPREILMTIGIKTSPLSVQDWRKGINGVKVHQILEGSLADGLLEKGDIIFQVNQQVIHQPEQFYRYILAHAVNKELKLQIIRKGTEETSKITLPPLNEK